MLFQQVFKSSTSSPAMIISGIICFSILISCNHVSTLPKNDGENTDYLLHELNDALTLAVILDGHKPPVGTRIYAYPNIAAYECLILENDDYASLQQQLIELDGLPIPEENNTYDFRVSMIEAFSVVAKNLVYLDLIIENKQQSLMLAIKPHINHGIYERSVKFGNKLGRAIINWSKSDGFVEIQNMPNYSSSDAPGHWKPTPPLYGEACEPHWFKLRLFILDSAQQFQAIPPPIFSTDSNSTFFQEAQFVYNLTRNLTEEQKKTAWFWNDLPSNTDIQGHLMTTKRQVSPPGHWVGITKTACIQNSFSLIQTSEAYTLVCIAMADAFKTNWHTKYYYDLIRPISYINKHIDPSWTPLLETPMFPEYTSAHSTMSAAAATVLSTVIDSSMAYVDSSEVLYGYGVREFSSFYQAAYEVTLSRVYGGIHYRFACVEGSRIGHDIGRFMLKRLRTKKSNGLGARVPQFSVKSISLIDSLESDPINP